MEETEEKVVKMVDEKSKAQVTKEEDEKPLSREEWRDLINNFKLEDHGFYGPP